MVFCDYLLSIAIRNNTLKQAIKTFCPLILKKVKISQYTTSTVILHN